MQRIRAGETPAADLAFLPLDQADLASVRRAAELAAAEPRIDVLLNNAGVMFPPLTRTQDGFELQFRRQPPRHLRADRTAAAEACGDAGIARRGDRQPRASARQHPLGRSQRAQGLQPHRALFRTASFPTCSISPSSTGGCARRARRDGPGLPPGRRSDRADAPRWPVPHVHVPLFGLMFNTAAIGRMARAAGGDSGRCRAGPATMARRTSARCAVSPVPAQAHQGGARSRARPAAVGRVGGDDRRGPRSGAGLASDPRLAW